MNYTRENRIEKAVGVCRQAGASSDETRTDGAYSVNGATRACVPLSEYYASHMIS